LALILPEGLVWVNGKSEGGGGGGAVLKRGKEAWASWGKRKPEFQ